MRTVTFYSYKGGVGRSLLLANVAHALRRLGRKVLVVDLDLEAPGLHFKLLSEDSTAASPGVLALGETHLALTVSIPIAPGLDLIPARPIGPDVDAASYWRSLADLEWRSPAGSALIRSLVAFQAHLADTHAYDYLLIDARTGITNVGTVATSLLADTVLLCTIATPECLEGTAEVYRALSHGDGPVLALQGKRDVWPVIMRLPAPEGLHAWVDEWETARSARNAVGARLGLTMAESERVPIVRQDTTMQAKESVLWAEADSDPLPVMLDYARVALELDGLGSAGTLLDTLARVDAETASEVFSRRLQCIAMVAPTPHVLSAQLRLRAKSDRAEVGLNEAILAALLVEADPDSVAFVNEVLAELPARPSASIHEAIADLLHSTHPEMLDEEGQASDALLCFLARMSRLMAAGVAAAIAEILVHRSLEAADHAAGDFSTQDPSLLRIRAEIALKRKDSPRAFDCFMEALAFSEDPIEGGRLAGAAAELVFSSGSELLARRLLAELRFEDLLKPGDVAALHVVAGRVPEAELWLANAIGGVRSGPHGTASVLDSVLRVGGRRVASDVLSRLRIDNDLDGSSLDP